MSLVDILLVSLGVLVAVAIVVFVAIYVGWIGFRGNNDWKR